MFRRNFVFALFAGLAALFGFKRLPAQSAPLWKPANNQDWKQWSATLANVPSDPPLNAAYNGITFSPQAKLLAFDVRPVYDHGKRTVAYHVATITLQDTFPAHPLRFRLTQPGGDFTFKHPTFGQLAFSQGAAGLVWGPRPTLLETKTDGSVLWRVEVAMVKAPGEPAPAAVAG